MAQLHSIFSVRADIGGAYLVTADITDMRGDRNVVDYALTPGDTFGLAPVIRGAVNSWINSGSPVAPYVAPTAEERRAFFPTLSPRQIRLVLNTLGITEGMVEAALEGDPEGLIEWRYATQVSRLHPLVVYLGEHFELPPEQIDSLWIWASEL